MNITIETANTSAAIRTAARIREQVFGVDRKLPRLNRYAPQEILTLIAKAADSNTPIATLSVVDTTWDSELHGAVGLRFPQDARVARYSQMAVLRHYRGLHLPARLMAEAHTRFVVPREITHTWLLFPAATAHESYFCTAMGFVSSTGTFASEYGESRVLLRNEKTVTGTQRSAPAGMNLWPRAIAENEWVAQ